MKIFLSFLASSFTASVLNYFFHAFLAFKLGPAQFSTFTLFWSYLALVSITGSFLQYWASLNHINTHIEKYMTISIHSLAGLLFLAFFITGNTFLLIFTIAIEAMTLSLKMGSALGCGDYKTVNFINLFLSCSRIVFLILLPKENVSSQVAFYVVLASIILTEVFSRFLLSRNPKTNLSATQDDLSYNWTGPLLISFLVSILPQLNIFWVNLFKTPQVLTLISSLAFITKGTFFIQLILAQWLFSKQKSDSAFTSFYILKYIIAFFTSLTALSLTGAIILPWIVKTFLNWNSVPSTLDSFWCGINGGLMSLFFLISQESIIRKKIMPVIAQILILALLIGIAGFMNVGLTTYFVMTSVGFLISIPVYLQARQ